MKKLLRWIILLVVAGLFLAAFFWEVRQSYSALDHKVVEILLIVLFFGFGWVWCGYNELSTYQEMFQKDSHTKQDNADLAYQLFNHSSSRSYHTYSAEDLLELDHEPRRLPEQGISQR